MRFLITSDLHGKIDVLDKLDSEFKAADAVFFGGDFAEFNKLETGKPAMQSLIQKCGEKPLFSVIGNCDSPDFIEEIEKADISIEGSLTFYEGLALAGSGGGSKFTGTTPFERSEEELLADFDVLKSSQEQISGDGETNSLVLIMHNPPKDTECDKIEGGVHVGSQKLRELIEEFKPLFVVTGHIHESAGISKIGESVVMNPGSLAEGKYGIIEAEKSEGGWKVIKSELKSI